MIETIMRSDRLVRTLGFILFCLFAVSCATVTAPVVAPQGESTPEVARTPSIQKISFTEGEESIKIQIEAGEPFDPPFYRIASNPLRIVIDLPKMDVTAVKEPMRIENGTISERFGNLDTSGWLYCIAPTRDGAYPAAE